jgi:DNA-binding CsgD family transcriptional regulator
MIVVSPARIDERFALQSIRANDVVNAIGTQRYSAACFEVFEQPLEVDHWALYRHNADSSVNCIATASRSYPLAAKENISRFIGRYYKFDPSLVAARARPLRSACVIKMEVADIRDRHYRHCFDLTHVQERVSFFHCAGTDLYQLSVFRRTGKRPFSPEDMARFSSLASFVVTCAVKHEMFKQIATGIPRHLDLDAIEQLLRYTPAGLSRREAQVCARVITGMTIDRTAADLAIKRTSIVTYRQRAYEKLNISRQNELVALVNNLRVNMTSSPALS